LELWISLQNANPTLARSKPLKDSKEAVCLMEWSRAGEEGGRLTMKNRIVKQQVLVIGKQE
jgi:hypothetical protein